MQAYTNKLDIEYLKYDILFQESVLCCRMYFTLNYTLWIVSKKV